jgi:hypothetical protein
MPEQVLKNLVFAAGAHRAHSCGLREVEARPQGKLTRGAIWTSCFAI